MENVIIIGVLLVVVLIAVLRVKKQAKGGCCGSGSNTIRDKKTLTAPKIGEKTLVIEGMSCENCAIRIENVVNRIDGVVCSANHKQGTATVTYSKQVDNEQLKTTVEKLGYMVREIRG